LVTLYDIWPGNKMGQILLSKTAQGDSKKFYIVSIRCQNLTNLSLGVKQISSLYWTKNKKKPVAESAPH